MTILTDSGRAYIDDYLYGRTTAPIDTIAVGTGDAPESTEDEELSNEIYRSNISNENVMFPEVPDTIASTYASIDIHGGLEVPVETEVTEVGVFVGETDQLIYRDVRSSVTIENGVGVTLRLRLDLEAI